MNTDITSFLIHWGIIALAMWIASHVFKGLRFKSGSALLIAALLLGFANAIVKPVLILLTLPLTLITLGLFILVINALMILLVAKLVSGFEISGFWTAFFASIFITIFCFLFELMLPGSSVILVPNTPTITI